MDSTSGSRHAKQRLKTVLRLMGGEVTREEAASSLGVSVRRVRELRATALEAAVTSLEPGSPGRPRKPRPTAEQRELERLEAETAMLAWELEVSQTREELALLMPNVVKSRGVPGKSRASRTSRQGGAAGRRTKRG